MIVRVFDVDRIVDACGWTNVAVSRCRSMLWLVCIKLAYGRGNRQLKLARALALRSRENERINKDRQRYSDLQKETSKGVLRSRGN